MTKKKSPKAVVEVTEEAEWNLDVEVAPDPVEPALELVEATEPPADKATPALSGQALQLILSRRGRGGA